MAIQRLVVIFILVAAPALHAQETRPSPSNVVQRNLEIVSKRDSAMKSVVEFAAECLRYDGINDDFVKALRREEDWSTIANIMRRKFDAAEVVLKSARRVVEEIKAGGFKKIDEDATSVLEFKTRFQLSAEMLAGDESYGKNTAMMDNMHRSLNRANRGEGLTPGSDLKLMLPAYQFTVETPVSLVVQSIRDAERVATDSKEFSRGKPPFRPK